MGKKSTNKTPALYPDALMVAALFERCDATKRKKMCAVHHSMYCVCPPTARQPCKKCLPCQAALRIGAKLPHRLRDPLRDYLDARDRQNAAIMADRNQAEEDATLDVDMYEKQLRTLIKGE